MLPLINVVALDLLVCLLTRVIAEETGLNVEKKLDPPRPPPPPPIPGGNGGGGASAATKDLPSDETRTKEEDTPVDTTPKQAAFFNAHGPRLISILARTAEKLLVYCRLHAMMIGNQPVFLPLYTDVPQPLLEGILKLVGKDPLQSKDSKPLFHSYIPDEVRDRIKLWNLALLIDPTHKEKLSRSNFDSSMNDLMVKFLNLHFRAFTGTRTFDPTCCLKSTLSSLMSLLTRLFEISPPEDLGSGDENLALSVLPPNFASIIPLACDVMMEFCGPDLLKIAKLCGEKVFSQHISEHCVKESFKLMRIPKVQGCNVLGPLIADFFALLSSMLDDATSQPVVARIQPSDPSCGVYTCAYVSL